MASSNCRNIPSFGERELCDLRNEIGRGGMGVVRLYKWKVDDSSQGIRKGRKVAVKHLDVSSDLDGVVEEAKILWPLHEKCKYILRMFGLMNEAGVGIVLDYMKYGNIADFFSTVCNHNDALSNMVYIWQLKSRAAMQVCEGMAYLHGHQRPILHCDLKAVNVLLDEELNVKICDFGLAKIKRLTTKAKSDEIKSRGLSVNCPAGTVTHVAPELLRVGAQATKQSDVYSFGILVWELVTGCLPYGETSNQFIIINEVLKKKRPDLQLIPTDCPDPLRKVMEEAWRQDPGRRPEFPALRRRFFIDGGNQPIHDSVEFAKRTWKSQRETTPKDIHTRSTNNYDGCGSESYFQTQVLPPQRCPIAERQLRHDNDSMADPAEDELMFSKDSNVASSQRTVSEATRRSTEDLREPLIVQPRRMPRALPNAPKRCVCNKAAVFFCVLAVLLGAGALVVGRYLIPRNIKGCCLNCFDPFEPGMQSTCEPVSADMIAPPGSTCKFSCDDGYVINGNITELKCGNNGVWLGPLPYCRKIRRCSQLTKPANGGDFKCTSGNFEESKCSFSCQDGYQLKRPGGGVEPSPGAFDVSCKSDDLLNYQWSGEEPYCEKVVTCPPPTSDQTVMVKCVPPYSINSKSDSGNQKDQTYSNGTTCSFSCPDTTSLNSSETTGSCLNTGKWNTTTAVTCINAECYRTPWKRAEMNESIRFMAKVSVYGSISKLSPMLDGQSDNSQYFLGEMINECSTIQFVCFDKERYPTMKKFKQDAVAVQLRNIDIKRSERYGLQVLINTRAVVTRSSRTVPTAPPNPTITPLSEVLASMRRSDKVNVRAIVVSKEHVQLKEVRGKSVPLYISHLSDGTAKMELSQWRSDRVPLNKTVVITDLEVDIFGDKKFLQMTTYSEVKPQI